MDGVKWEEVVVVVVVVMVVVVERIQNEEEVGVVMDASKLLFIKLV
jgi:hypothetical protein